LKSNQLANYEKRKNSKSLKCSNNVATTAFLMTLIYGYIIKQKEERWLNTINDRESFELISDTASHIDSIYHKKDTTFYFKKDSLIGYSIRNHNK